MLPSNAFKHVQTQQSAKLPLSGKNPLFKTLFHHFISDSVPHALRLSCARPLSRLLSLHLGDCNSDQNSRILGSETSILSGCHSLICLQKSAARNCRLAISTAISTAMHRNKIPHAMPWHPLHRCPVLVQIVHAHVFPWSPKASSHESGATEKVVSSDRQR